jgi:hypothetical protein
VHEDGVVTGEPGLYFVGRLFLHAGSSIMVHGVGRDAARIAQVIANSGLPETPAMMVRAELRGSTTGKAQALDQALLRPRASR